MSVSEGRESTEVNAIKLEVLGIKLCLAFAIVPTGKKNPAAILQNLVLLKHLFQFLGKGQLSGADVPTVMGL